MLNITIEAPTNHQTLQAKLQTEAVVLLERLLSEGHGEAYANLNGFLDIGVYSPAVYKALLGKLAEPDRDSSLDMLTLCKEVTEIDPAFTEFLIDRRDDYDADVKDSIAEVIAESPFLDQYLELLESFERSSVFGLIRDIVNNYDASLASALLRLWEDNLDYETDESVRAGTLIILRRLGSAAVPCFHAVFETAIYDKSEVTRRLAAKALVAIDHKLAAANAFIHYRYACSCSTVELLDRCVALIRELEPCPVADAAS